MQGLSQKQFKISQTLHGANPLPVTRHARLRTYHGFRAGGVLTRQALPVVLRSKTKITRSSGSLVIFSLFERFTERSIKAIMLAQEECRKIGDLEVAPQHILLGLIVEDAGFLGSGITADSAREIYQKWSTTTTAIKPEAPRDLPFSRAAKTLFEAALQESRRMGMSFISPEHVFLATANCDDTDVAALMNELGIDVPLLKTEATRRLRGEAEGEGAPTKKIASQTGVATRSFSSTSASKALDEFCRDLCAEAAANRTDPVIGRSKEVARVVQILGRRQKNNPILLGEAGVGKTAIAEGLARAIVQRSLPDGSALPSFLLGKRVLSLDVGLLIAGAKERGELESRVKKILSEASETGNIILMIDEIHTLVGAGSVSRGGGGGGGLDISNMLKPALARSQLQCIGATTLDEHRKYIESDAALERRFQPVVVEEPSESDTLAILEGLADRYERHHRCVYSSDALAAAVKLSSRYIADRNLPDKAIDLIDEAGSRVRIASYNALKEAGAEVRDAAVEAYVELRQVMETKDEAARDLLFEEATLLRCRELELKSKLTGDADSTAAVPIVTADHIASIVAAWTGVPVQQMGEDERERLLGLGDALRSRVIGQEEAVECTARAVARAASGLKHTDRPIATLMFSGPTGVGKTELAKALADAHFGGGGGGVGGGGAAAAAAAASLIRLDMSEYMERHSVAKLIGSPPGYVGYGDGGKLTEAVRRKPFSLVLFDEIEKAHPDVFNMLLQVMEDGRLTDSQGRTVSFKNALIVLTTNVGSSIVAKGGSGGIGFELPGDDVESTRQNRLRSLVMEELKSYFRPEMLNRLDDVIVFRRLTKQDVTAIASLELAKTAERAAERGIGLRLDDDVMELLIEEGFSETMGARELRRAVTRIVDDALSDAILTGKVAAGQIALLRKTGTTGGGGLPVEVVALNGGDVSGAETIHSVEWMSA